MRYLVQHPITPEEILELLEHLPEDNPKGTPPEKIICGGVNDLIRSKIIAFFHDKSNMEKLIKTMEI
jgi:hypothetical protein